MGKIIDRIVLMLFFTVALYAFFLNALQSVPAAIALTLLVGALMRSTIQKRRRRWRMTAFEARTLMRRWAFLPDGEAERWIASLLLPQTPMVYVGRHPSSALSVNDVYALWRAHAGEDRFVLATLCEADPRARMFSRTLKNPAVELLDAPKLLPKIRASELEPPRLPRGGALAAHVRELLVRLPERRPWNQTMLIGLGLLAVYWLTANVGYLFASLAMLLIAGVSLRTRRI